ncbi:MAG: methyltransferase domain-containing protein [Solirubrobacterales bacterium]
MTLILNLGCGSRVSANPCVQNVDWSPYLRIARRAWLRKTVRPLLDPPRVRKLDEIPDNVRVHNLSRGVPWPDGSADAVYHSHLLEHLDREVAPVFCSEIRRVLRPRGVHRVVVPDLEVLCRELIADLDTPDPPSDAEPDHDDKVRELLEQSVRREAYGTRTKSPVRRKLENVLLGDARKRGETHQWMYDEMNLRSMLEDCGFVRVARAAHDSSRIPNWSTYGLDQEKDGSPYKPGSLYMEAEVP